MVDRIDVRIPVEGGVGVGPSSCCTTIATSVPAPERRVVTAWQQIADWRRAISYPESLDRQAAVFAQVPVINGASTGRRRVPLDARVVLEQEFYAEEPPMTRGGQQRSGRPGHPPRSARRLDLRRAAARRCRVRESATLRSMRWMRMCRSGQWIDQV